MPRIVAGDVTIGDGAPCFVIAEAGVNHNGSLEMALALVDAAADAGADAVKFQRRHLPSLYPDALLQDANLAEWGFQYLLPVLRDTELSDDEFRTIRARCSERGIRFMCTAWDENSLALLEELGVAVHKVASADLVNLPLLEAMAATGKPLLVSTGMATEHEIERSVEHLRAIGASFALLHCVSTYPAPFDGLNLRYMQTLGRFGVPVGYSSHERGISVATAAVGMGASVIEKHITLDRTLPGPDHPASLEPQGMTRLVRDIRNLELALGGGEKRLNAMEIQNRQILRKSLVAARDLAAGTVVERGMVKVMGPGKGLSPQRIDELLGVTLDRAVAREAHFSEGDLAGASTLLIESTTLRRPWGLKARFHDLDEILALRPQVVELHFSEHDPEHDYAPGPEPRPEQLIVHAPEFAGQRLLDLAAVDDERRERAIELVQATIDATVRLGEHFAGGPPTVVIHVGGMSMDAPDPDVDALLARGVESFRRLDARGTVLLPENLPPRPWYLGGQWFQNLFTEPRHMVEFCGALDLEMTLDVSHAQLACAAAGTDLADFVTEVLPLVRHVHLADASGVDGEGVQIGEGVVRWEEILDLLSTKEFSWVPEIWSGHLHGCAGFIEAVNRLAAYDRL